MNVKGGGGSQLKTPLTVPQKCCGLVGIAAKTEGSGVDVETEWTSAQKVPNQYPCPHNRLCNGLCEWNGLH